MNSVTGKYIKKENVQNSYLANAKTRFILWKPILYNKLKAREILKDKK